MRHKIPTIGVVDDGKLTVNTQGPNGPPNPSVFDFGLNTFAWGEKIGEYALKHCPDGIAVLHNPSTYGAGRPVRHQARRIDKAGKTIKIDHTITENWSTGATTGLMPEVNAIKAAGIKCVDAWLTPQDQAAFVSGYPFGRLWSDDLRQRRNQRRRHLFQAGWRSRRRHDQRRPRPRSPPKPPAAQTFRNDYKKRFNIDATPFAETSYDSIMMLAQVIKDAKSTKPMDLQKGFNAVPGFKGITGDLSFSEKNHITINAGATHPGEI